MKTILFIILPLVVIGGIAAFWISNNTNLAPIILPPPGDISATTTSSVLALPTGFSYTIFAKDLVNPRVMQFDPEGNLLTSITSEGNIVVLTDADKNGSAEKATTLLSGLNRPHGIVLGKCVQLGLKKTSCKLYVAETDKVSVYAYNPVNLTATAGAKLVDLPTGGNHFSRTLAWLPGSDESKLLISIGSSCNVCREEDVRRATIQVLDLSTAKFNEFALAPKMTEFVRGLRNAVFLAEHPTTHEIWVTEMGRDLLGDDTPPDEINILKEGKNYGWPICYGKNIHDTQFDKNTYIRNPCMESFETPSFIDIPAHSAPLGLVFVPSSYPARYRGNVLVAYHGSWNRSVPTGYKVVMMKLDQKGAYLGSEDFMTGFLKDGGAIGRPADLKFGPHDDALYISDDKAGVVYRVTFTR